MSSLPAHSLLLSHTDLDWNPIRYLRECEGVRRDDVTHLSFQLIPYPWFASRQASLYPNVSFPNVKFKGVSTDRSTEGNAVLVRDMLRVNGADYIVAPFEPTDHKEENSLNLKKKSKKSKKGEGESTGVRNNRYPGGIFLDMQAVNEVEIVDGGAWRGLMLMPWGTLYRVLKAVPVSEAHTLHNASYRQLLALQRVFPTVDGALVLQYPAGSWEFAAMSVYFDAHYQLGINLLTYAVEAQASVNTSTLPMVLDRLLVASELLRTTLRAVDRFETISSPAKDVHKNTAVAFMRLQALFGIGAQFRDSMPADEDVIPMLLSKTLLTDLRNMSVLHSLRLEAVEVISAFIGKYPQDSDVPTFASTVAAIEKSILLLQHQQQQPLDGGGIAGSARHHTSHANGGDTDTDRALGATTSHNNKEHGEF